MGDTGSPLCISRNGPMKIALLHGHDLGQAFSRPSSSSETIISRTAARCARHRRTYVRCGTGRCLRHRNRGPPLASWGVSALERTLSSCGMNPPGHECRNRRSIVPVRSVSFRHDFAAGTSPRVIMSPFLTTTPFLAVKGPRAVIHLGGASPRPATRRFMPRATTPHGRRGAPPRAVRMPSAASSRGYPQGNVSMRTSITLRPIFASASASSAVKMTSPETAPGEAGNPFAMMFFTALGSREGCRLTRVVGATRRTAVFLVDQAFRNHVDGGLDGRRCSAFGFVSGPCRSCLDVW